MDELINCVITEDEFEWFKREYGGTTPCSEYGACDNCPWAEKEE